MALNFDSMPQSRSEVGGGGEANLLEKGTYQFTTKNAAMQKGPNSTYLQVELHTTRPNGSNCIVYDKFFESDKPLPQYKIRQFLVATGCMMQGSFELADLVKIVNNKTINAAIKIEKSEGYAPKNVVDVFDDDIYTAIKGTAAAKRAEAQIADEECPFSVGESEEY